MRPLKTSALTGLLLCAALWATGSVAQYKWIDQDGKVNYGDRMPANPTRVLPAPAIGARGSSDGAQPALPVALQTAVARFPVLLFTTPGGECIPCASARSHLSRRGVPFSEKTLATEADLAAFRQLGFKDPGVPALSVGRERLIGYEAQAWDRLLDASAYPKTSMLPAGYPRSAPEPLAAPRPAAGTLAGDASPGSPAGAASEEPYFKPARPPRPAASTAPQSPPSTIRF